MPTIRENIRNCRILYSNYDLNWVQYIRDHYQVLVDGSSELDLDPYKHSVMRYRLADFLDEAFNYPRSAIWIVLMVNQLSSEAEFAELDSILIPEERMLNTLYNTYNTIQSQANRISR